MSQALPLLNPFVGRQREQKAYRQMLAQSSPWVLVITGQGGMGKSALLRHLKEHTPPEIRVALLQFADSELRSDPWTCWKTCPGNWRNNVTNSRLRHSSPR